jgi:hypothetical protein
MPSEGEGGTRRCVRLGIKRSLRDARVSAFQYRGLKPTANRNRSLRDEVVPSIRLLNRPHSALAGLESVAFLAS